MRVLGIDSATRSVGVGIVEDGLVRGDQSLPVSQQHAATLLPLIEAALRGAQLTLRDLDGIAVSIGPGSFTGLRVGLAVAKGLAFAAERPLVGIPTLEAFARAARPLARVVWSVLDARRGELYTAAFAFDGAEVCCLREPATVPVEGLLEQLVPPCRLVGDGIDAYRGRLRAQLGAEETWLSNACGTATVVARLGAARLAAVGGDDLATLEPHYASLCDAERGGGATH